MCTKPSNLSSHGGVIKAVPTKQNELNRFPRPGESVLGSGKILPPPRAGARAVSNGLSAAWPSVGQCHTLGNAVAGVCPTLTRTTLPDCSVEEHRGCSHTREELSAWKSPSFLSTPGYFCFADLVSAANGHLSLQQEFTKPGRWVITNTQPLAKPTAALHKALRWLHSHGTEHPLLTLTLCRAAAERNHRCQSCM